MSMTTETPAKAKRERPKMDPDVKVALIGLFLIIAGAIAVIIAFRHQMASVDMEAPFILWTLLTVLGGFAAIRRQLRPFIVRRAGASLFPSTRYGAESGRGGLLSSAFGEDFPVEGNNLQSVLHGFSVDYPSL